MDKIIKKKVWTKKRILVSISLSLILILILYNLVFNQYRYTETVKKHTLTIKEVVTGDFLDFIAVTGTLHPERTIILDAMEGGRVEEIFSTEGQLIKKGEVILRLSNTNLQMNMMNREAELADQMNNLRNTRLLMEQNKLSLYGQLYDSEHILLQSKRDYNQKKELFENKLISKNEYLNSFEEYLLFEKKTNLIKQNIVQDSIFRRVQIEQLNESVKRLQDNLKIIRDKMEGLTIKAPVSGQLSSLNVEIGESKFSGERLGVINVIDNFKIQANISEYYLNRIQSGLQAKAESDKKEYPVHISRIHPEVKNGSFLVEFLFENIGNENFRIGQSFVVKIELGSEKQAILLPKGAFFGNTGGQWVFVMDTQMNKAYKREIKLNMQNPDYYEVVSGLNVGDKVIVSSYDNFKDAEILKIVNE
jgi:HlyD family secretion protein